MSESGFLNRSTLDLDYVVYCPKGMAPTGLPAILFLHGKGECGHDGLRQTLIGLCHAIRSDCSRWPFLVVAPQKRDADALWAASAVDLDRMLAEVEAEFAPDPHRRYLTGLSQGGRGTFDLATRLVWTFAAAAAVCGWTEPAEACDRLAGTPLWAFHGDQDPVVPYRPGQELVERLTEMGSEARFTLYEGVGHNSWDSAYLHSDLPAWLLAHSSV